jgi:hypothetical protein
MPLPVPVVFTVRAYPLSVKVAVHVLLESTKTVVGLALPEQAPLQPVKVDPVLAAAVTVAVAPYVYVPVPVVVPLPFPAVFTVRAYELIAKFATIVWLACTLVNV